MGTLHLGASWENINSLGWDETVFINHPRNVGQFVRLMPAMKAVFLEINYQDRKVILSSLRPRAACPSSAF